MRAARVDAPDLGYRFRSLEWRCPLARDGQGGWRCDGELHATGGKPFRLSVALASGSTDAALSRGDARFALHRSAATPDGTLLDLTRVPVASIGSASCRERAGQDVEVSGVAGSLKKNRPTKH